MTPATTLHERLTIVDGVCPLMQTRSAWDGYIEGRASIVAPTLVATAGIAETMTQIARWLRNVREDDRLFHVDSVERLHTAATDERLGIVFHFQDTEPIGGDPAMLEVYRRLGVLMIQLAYNRRNAVGDGSTEPTNGGLSELGHDVVREMDRLGIVVDLSHTGERTSLDAIEASTAPVVFSHSNALALHDNPRNITDEQARAAADSGGLVGVNAFPAFLTDAPVATVRHVGDHLEHWLTLLGPDHVAIGLDHYDGDDPETYEDWVRRRLWSARAYPPPPHPFPAGLEAPAKLGNLTAELVRRGIDEATIAKVMGGNWIRVWSAVWKDVG